MPNGGMVNEAWQIGGGHILRIVKEGGDPECDSEAPREATVVPLLVAAGMTVPRLVAHDTQFAPRPYTLYELATGELIGFSKHPIEHYAPAYRQIGRELFVLHNIAVNESIRSGLRTDGPVDIPKAVAKTIKVGAITQEEGDDIVAMVAHLDKIGGHPPGSRLIHNDVHPWNLMGDPSTGVLTAILDWGDTTHGDPARDFASMPLQCVPLMIEGYREASCNTEELRSLSARSIVVGMLVALGELRDPGMTGFDRKWWRMPPGGWGEMKLLIARVLPIDF